MWVRARLYKLQKGCTRLAVASDKVYQLLAHGRWYSPGTPASSTTKTGRHDIAEILLKVALNTKNQSTKTLAINLNPKICCHIYKILTYRQNMCHANEKRWADHSWHKNKNPTPSINSVSRYSLWNHKTTSPTVPKPTSKTHTLNISTKCTKTPT